MKKIVIICCLLMVAGTAYAIGPSDVELVETRQELEAKKNKFLALTTQDLDDYEGISRQIDRNVTVGAAPDQNLKKWRRDFNSYAQRRLNMIRKIFAVFRGEFGRLLDHLEGTSATHLPAFADLIKVLDESLNDAKMKGSKEKWQGLKARAAALLNKVKQPGIMQNYKDELVLDSDSNEKLFLEARIKLLHRWLLEGRFNDAEPYIASLAKTHANHPLCLGLQSHFWLEDYRRHMAGFNIKDTLEKQLSKKFGAGSVTITLKGEKSLPKAFLFYLEALRNGFPPEQEIPGLLPSYWEYIEVMYKKVHPYWRYPDRFNNFREYMKDMAARCKAVVEFVPFKKYARPAYGILSDMHRYWSEDKAGPAIIDYRELMNLNRILRKKKL